MFFVGVNLSLLGAGALGIYFRYSRTAFGATIDGLTITAIRFGSTLDDPEMLIYKAISRATQEPEKFLPGSKSAGEASTTQSSTDGQTQAPGGGRKFFPGTKNRIGVTL